MLDLVRSLLNLQEDRWELLLSERYYSDARTSRWMRAYVSSMCDCSGWLWFVFSFCVNILLTRSWPHHQYYTLVCFIQEQRDNEGDVLPSFVYLPRYLNSRWSKLVKSDQPCYYYHITAALKAINIDREEFLKCWDFVKSRTAPEEVFSWFKDAAFGQIPRGPASTSLRVAFARKILQRYKEIEVYACIFCLPCVIVVVLVRF